MKNRIQKALDLFASGYYNPTKGPSKLMALCTAMTEDEFWEYIYKAEELLRKREEEDEGIPQDRDPS